MHRIFVPIYNYFKFHKPLMYIIMAVSFGVFLFFGLKVKYEEDISKLLPESSVESQLAFGSIGLKDKVFIQVTSADEPLDVVTLAERTDEFMEYLLEVDSSSHYIANILYQMEPEMALNALDFVLEHVPSFVDTSAYPAFEKALEPETAAAQMQKDYDMLMEDEAGDITQMIANDPLDLKAAVLGDLLGRMRCISLSMRTLTRRA